MKAVFKRPKTDFPELIELPIPSLKPDEVLVKVYYAGICKTDLKVGRGELPTRSGGVILGHEFSGEVIKFGTRCREISQTHMSILDIKVGDFVVANPMLDSSSDAMLGKDLNGCFAEYIAVPIKQLVKVDYYDPKSMMKELAYCEPVAAAQGVFSKIPAHIYDLIIAGNPEDRIAKLVSKCLLQDGIDEVKIIPPEKLLIDDDLGKPKHKCIVECCPEFAGKLLRCLENGGTLILKSRGYVALDTIVNDIVMKQLNIVGAKYSSFYEAIGWIYENLKLVDTMISKKTYKLDDFGKAFAEASKANAKKVMFKCVQ